MILPSPTSSFEWVAIDHVPGLVCRPLEPIARHIFTTRQWRLAAGTADSGAQAPWSDVAASLDIQAARLVRVAQVHGAEVAVACGDDHVRQDTDIIVSDDSTLALAIRVADCVPLLIADRRTGAVAAAHAGWRGLAARVPAVAVDALRREYGSRAGDLIAAAGPSIGACCYEVGSSVRESFVVAGFGSGALERWFLKEPAPTLRNPSMAGVAAPARRVDHWFFDGWTSTRDQLLDAGLPSDQIFVAETCTASHPEAFCSYRRDGAPAGRLAGAIRPAHPRR